MKDLDHPPRSRARVIRPRLLYGDDAGLIRDHPTLLAAGQGGPDPVRLDQGEVIELPRGSDLFYLPGRTPLGWDPRRRAWSALAEDREGRPAHAIAAFLAPAHTASLLAAALRRRDAPPLPLFSYAAVGYAHGRYWVAAQRVDADPRQDPWRFDPAAIRAGVEREVEQSPENTLLQQLRRCALEYQCRAAQNFFLTRYEAPLPISVVCNARCLGCISLQADGTFKAAHDRLAEPPEAEHVAAVAIRHISRVARAVVSFGQGCEGEPLLMRALITDSVRRIRTATPEGTINLNSNASLPEVVTDLAAGGLDSLRVSLNSARPAIYEAYYRPREYRFGDVIASMEAMRRRGRFVSLNLLYFPGVTDRPEEIEALATLIPRAGISLIQLRNLNIDPELYRSALPDGAFGPGLGLSGFMRELHARAPRLRFGYFNPPKEIYRTW